MHLAILWIYRINKYIQFKWSWPEFWRENTF